MQATGTFTVDSWDNAAYDDRDGTILSRASLTKTFRGDLEAAGTVEMLSATVDGAPAAYVALERVVGQLAGRSGAFLFQHSATASGPTQTLHVAVVPGSGSGELVGLTGQFDIVIGDDGGHAYVFDCELG